MDNPALEERISNLALSFLKGFWIKNIYKK